MINIKIICFNKMSKEYLEIYNLYLNKLKKFVDINIVEITESSTNDIKTNMARNEEAIKTKIKNINDPNIFLLEIDAIQQTSEAFAKTICDIKDFKGGNVTFIIGPSDGFSYNFKTLIKNKISFGKLTLPYNLVRVVLLEQIYRSIKIIRKEPYHK